MTETQDQRKQDTEKTEKKYPLMRRIVIGVDPAVTHQSTSDETGIIVAGVGVDENYYVLDDLSGRLRPVEWAARVVKAYHTYQAERVVAEVNQGGDMVESTLRVMDPRISYKGVRASKGKMVRAEPVAALYEQGRVFHRQCFLDLEKQMCAFTGDPKDGTSPDRLDALVWALSELGLSDRAPGAPHLWIAAI